MSASTSERPRVKPFFTAITIFRRSFPARLEEIAREKGVDHGAIEIWFCFAVCERPRARQRRRGTPRAGTVRAIFWDVFGCGSFRP